MTCMPSSNSILRLLETNPIAPSLTGALESVRSKISVAETSINGIGDSIISKIGDLQSTIQTQISNVSGQLDEYLTNVTQPIMNLQTELTNTLTTLRDSPKDFLAQIDTLKLNFPDAPWDDIMSQICAGTLDVSTIPNLDLTENGVIENATASIAPNEAPEDTTNPVTLPEVTTPDEIVASLIDISKRAVSRTTNALNMTYEEYRSHARAVLAEL